MKSIRLRVPLAFATLALAGAAAMVWPREDDDRAGDVTLEDQDATPPGRLRMLSSQPTPRATRAPREHAGEPGDDRGWTRSPIDQRVERRLAQLTESLGLTADQRRLIRPLLRRSDPAYRTTTPMGAPGPAAGALTTTRANEGIHELLDPIQQIEFEDQLLDSDAWWSEVIARLEEDLRRSTSPANELMPPTDGPVPAPGEPSDGSAGPPAGAPSPHPGRNLFELIEEGEP